MLGRTLTLSVLVAGMLSPAAALAVGESGAMSNQDWWPNRLDLQPLRQHAAESDPMGSRFDYAKEFRTLDLEAVKQDIRRVLTTSQDWWPADYGNYGPFFIRMAWHAAGTYRVLDGRGGADGGEQRFEPLNSWPDNANLDKARRLLWPIKQKYGRKLSWGDLMVLTGNVALESMGFRTIGFAGGRVDSWEPDLVFWGPEHAMLGDERHTADRKLKGPLAAAQMGLIYVNPEGPNGVPDPLASAQEIRDAFGRMAMDDEETVALIAGGHSFGKAHGAHAPTGVVGAPPAGAGLAAQGFGWKSSYGKGNAEDTITSGLEGSWTASPTYFTTQYLDNLFRYDWVQTKSPAGAIQWVPANGQATNLVPDAHLAGVRHAPIMFTTDLALKFDPSYRKIAMRFKDHPKAFETAFAKAWFKLTHRDLGPRSRYLGALVPQEVFSWQDPLPAVTHPLVDARDAAKLKAEVLASGLSTSELVKTAWASAATYRSTDHRGGANGARIRLEPQREWPSNDPQELGKVLSRLEAIRTTFNHHQTGGKRVSLADLIVLGGDAAVERAAKNAGVPVSVPFQPGRTDASQAQTDVRSFGFLKPTADGFRNYYSTQSRLSPAEMLVDKANSLSLTVPETTVLVGGMRVLDANAAHVPYGVFTHRRGTLSTDFFVNLLDMSTRWSKDPVHEGLYVGVDRKTGRPRWTATPVDLVFGSNSELRAVSEVYAASDARAKFVRDFVAAWAKVMDLDRR